jgi:ribosomal-protein-alanine acetyltransferase
VDEEREIAKQACTIRKMTIADVGAVREILREAPEAAEWSETTIRESIAVSRTNALVSERDGEIGGCVFGLRVDEEAEILNLAVRREHRRNGDGRKLVGRLMEEWTQVGVTRVYLEVRESNAGAQEFYKALGFEQAGRRPKYYANPEEDALVLEREKWRNPQVSTR